MYIRCVDTCQHIKCIQNSKLNNYIVIITVNTIIRLRL